MSTNQSEPRKPLCSNAWAIPPSPLMLEHGNDYHTCSVCGKPCDVVDLKEDMRTEPNLSEFKKLIRYFGNRNFQIEPGDKRIHTVEDLFKEVSVLFQADKEAAVRPYHDLLTRAAQALEIAGSPDAANAVRRNLDGFTHPQAGESEGKS